MLSLSCCPSNYFLPQMTEEWIHSAGVCVTEGQRLDDVECVISDKNTVQKEIFFHYVSFR